MNNRDCPDGYVEVFNVTCQNCGNDCDTYKQVDMGEDWNWWCYCEQCNIETFHLCFISKSELNKQ